MLLESVVVGVLGSLLGLVAGIGVSMALKAFLGVARHRLPVDRLAAAAAHHRADASCSARWSRCCRLCCRHCAPVACRRWRRCANLRSRTSAAAAGGFSPACIVASVGVAGIVAALAGASFFLLGLGVFLFWIGVLVLGPVLALVAAKVIGAPVAKAVQGHRADGQGNAARNPKRTSRAAAPVLIGVALVTAVALLAATLKAQVREIFSEQFVGDYVVKTDDFTGFGGLSPDLADQLNGLPEVAAAAGIGVKLAKVDGKDGTVTLVDPQRVGEVFDLHLTSGSYADLTDDLDAGVRRQGQERRSDDRRRADRRPHRVSASSR